MAVKARNQNHIKSGRSRWIKAVDAQQQGVSGIIQQNKWHHIWGLLKEQSGKPKDNSQLSLFTARGAVRIFQFPHYYAYDCAGNRTGAQGDSSGTFAGNNFATTATQYTYNNVNELVGSGAGGPITFQATTVNPVISAVINDTQVVTIALLTGHSSPQTGDNLWVLVHDKSLTHAEAVEYTVKSTDTTTTLVATGVKNAINADAVLSSLGITATSSGSVVTLTPSNSVNATTYTSSLSSGAVETISLGSAGALATISPSNAFVGSPSLAGGSSSTSNTLSVTAVSGGGTAATLSPAPTVSINAATPATLTYDNDGNLISDGTNSYAWDAENRLIQITYPGSGNSSQFTYDGLGRCVKIVETVSSSVTSTKQFIWCDNERCEVRDSGGTTVLAQFFGYGETISGTSYYFTVDHLSSVREMTNSSGTIVWQQSFDPFGVPTTLVSTTPADMGYAGYYLHSRSGLNLTATRAYNATMGRFINRDPIGERGGINLFGYVNNDPMSFSDPSGLDDPWGATLPTTVIPLSGGPTPKGTETPLTDPAGGPLAGGISKCQPPPKSPRPRTPNPKTPNPQPKSKCSPPPKPPAQAPKPDVNAIPPGTPGNMPEAIPYCIKQDRPSPNSPF